MLIRASITKSEKQKKNPHAVALSRLGASKGGAARAAALTPKRRKAIARQAALARWKKAAEEALNAKG